MSTAIIEAHALEKTFLLRVAAGSLKNMLVGRAKRGKQVVEALRGIDLAIQPGEAVALLGRNGCGKSTLLSLIGRIYLPSAGSLDVRGRVAPLLELGAGFHPDLTGRENIEMNGVILGLSRKQVAALEEEIIEFAELAPFIDAQMRTYSSGMFMRLGFSVAAHTDAEILLVDEALAVGDEEFQEKCFTRIERLKREGRTIFFVSHDMTDVTRVATRVVWMKSGLIHADGDPGTLVAQYLDEAHRHAAEQGEGP